LLRFARNDKEGTPDVIARSVSDEAISNLTLSSYYLVIMITAEHRQALLHTFLKNRVAVVGLVGTTLIFFIALLAPWLAPYDPLQQSISNRLLPANTDYWLGTDGYGRDLLSRIIWGARPSLFIGISSVGIGMILGMILGMIAGYYGGMFDSLFMRTVDVLMAFPTFLLGLLIATVLGGGMINLIIAIAVTMIPRFARLARAPTLSIVQKEYLEASKAIGQKDVAILLWHILPNILGPIFVLGTLWVATAIRIEASLSFLGLGVQPPTPTWGGMLNEGVDRITEAPWMAVYPGFALTTTVIAFNMIGDGLRDIIDPKLRV
jgi:peptide/nickel transport system permease protein